MKRLLGPRRERVVTLYGKPDCHLCEDALALLERLAELYPLRVTEVDITTDPELFRRYDIRIPVVVVDGKDEIEAPLTAAKLRRPLRRTPLLRGR
jgi:thiol-disulfide isomerase/thioredoxin